MRRNDRNEIDDPVERRITVAATGTFLVVAFIAIVAVVSCSLYVFS